MKSSAAFLAALAFFGTSTVALAQISPAAEQNSAPTYRVSVVSRTTRAVKYEHRSGATKIDFQGTDLMPSASGVAKVESKRGTIDIDAEFSGLDKPTTFGTEYHGYTSCGRSHQKAGL